MSAAVFRSGTPSLSVPQTQNTAPVLDFNCLYTHDVRKKSKKWQDGFLRYHTFNKRVMVYDLPRNFVGDVHWKSSVPVQEGDEITLDDGTVMVEVGENVGSTETDLTELRSIAKRSSREDGHSSSPARPSVPRHINTPRNMNTPSSMVRGQQQLKHRSLNALLGTSRGQVGKASLPSKSPFEIRRFNDENATPDRAVSAKRRKVDDRTPLSSKAVQQRAGIDSILHLPKQSKVSLTKNARNKPNRVVVDLSKDEAEPKFLAGFSSNNLDPPSSPPNLPCSPPARDRVPSHDQGRNAANTTARSVGRRDATKAAEALNDVPQQSPFFSGERGVLQIAASVPKRKMLLCESQLSGRAKPASVIEPMKSQREILQGRLDRISKKYGQGSKQQAQANMDRPTSRGTSEDPIRLSQEDTQQLAQLESQIRPSLSRAERPDPDDTNTSIHRSTEERPLRRTASDAGAATYIRKKPAREPGAPVRISAPSRTIPKKDTPQPVPETDTTTVPAQQKQALPTPRTKKAPQRSVSLNITGSGTSTVMLRRQFQAPTAPKPEPPPARAIQPNAWSREAFDLFEWRPPDWDEENWCIKNKDQRSDDA